MTEQELRVGNWIFDNGDEQKSFQVEQICKDSDGFEGYYIVYRNGSFKSILSDKWGDDEIVLPVKLSEEWLLKLGCVKFDNRDLYGLPFCPFVISTPIYGVYTISKLVGDILYPITICKYVHQLQNFYFVVKGIEIYEA